jgi:Cytochrome c
VIRRTGLLAACTGLALAASAGAQPAPARAAADAAIGARIYAEGRLPSGAPITGQREGHEPVSGAAAACVQCHRPSGMGEVEGNTLIPPIAGTFLFAARGERHVATMDPRVGKLFNQAHDPYDEVTLARAIREGVDAQGRTLGVLMPRYTLGDGEMRGLIAYLRQLSAQWSPGVSPTQITLATVVTPDVDPARRKAFLETMRAMVRDKNGSTVVADPKKNRHHMVSAAELVLGTERTWDLQVWELKGAPLSWREQLEAHYRDHPAFALVSGLSDTTWQPMQDFCDQQKLPCWFPSVPASAADPGRYGFYFSGGVRLEARVLGQTLAAARERPLRVVQFLRDDEPGTTASAGLAEALQGSGIALAQVRLAPGEAAAPALRAGLSTLREGDKAVFWLRGPDVQALDSLAPPGLPCYFSGVLAGAEHAPVPAAWREHARLIYPYELPAARPRNLDYFRAWTNLRHIAVADEAMQSEAYFAMTFLTDTLAEMLDNLYRDYLVERAESMLDRREASKAELENRERAMLGREGDLLQRRGPMTMDESVRIRPEPAGAATASQGTTLYAHLTLGPGQRLASRSASIVRFTSPTGTDIVADAPPLVP